MTLCASCQQFDLQSLSHTTHQWRNFLLKSVVTAAQGGCSFCGLLLASLGGQAREMMCSASTAWVRIYFDRLPAGDGLGKRGLQIRWLHATVSYSVKPTPPEVYRTFHVAADEGKSGA